MMKSFLFLLMVYFIIASANAQTNPIYPLVNMNITMTQVGIDSTLNGSQILTDSSRFDSYMHVFLADTVNIHYLHVKIGSASGLSDIFQKSFTYDVFGQFADSTSYFRNLNKVTLGLGTLSNVLHYYAQLVLEKQNGNLTMPINFNK